MLRWDARGVSRYNSPMLARLVPALPLALTIALTFALAACGGKDDGDTAADAASEGPDDLPPAADVCAAACENFAECAELDPECEGDCLAAIEFLAMNNPSTDCGGFETRRQHCLSGLTCDELDAYGMQGAMYPCKAENDALGECAIE